MMSEPSPPAANTPHPPTEVRSLAIVVPPNTAGDAVMEALWGNVNFNLTATAIQRRLDRMDTYKRERSKTFGAAARGAVKEMKVHATGEPWQRFLEAQTRLRKAMKAKEELDQADIDVVMRYGATSSRLYAAAEQAAKAKKDEMERIHAKIDKVQAALRSHLRKGPGGHDVEEEALQSPLPGFEDSAKPPEPWMDEQTRQVTYDTLASELRVIDRDLAAANAAQDAAKVRKAEAAREQYSELLETLRAASLLDGLTPDEEDETVVADVEAGDEDPDIDIEHDGDPAPAGEAPFRLAPDGPPAGLEDPTKHPALQPVIAQTKAKRTAKKAAKKAGSRRGK